jgi:enoyl-[acyl-carrier protein] reductase II
MKTRITELFGIDLPILCGGMVWMSTAPLVAAVGNAGGLGLLCGGIYTAETLAAEIDRTRALTDKPFGVNVPLLWPPAAELMDVIIEKNVKVVFTSAGSPKKFTPMLKDAGIKVGHVVPNAFLAAKCQGAGVDVIIAEGSEGGGHVAFDEVSTMVLTPAVCDAVDIPVIAAGGIGTGRQIAAAFALGAEAVQIGTRFIATNECEGHTNFKQKILDAKETGTVVTGKKFSPVRNIRNTLSETVLQMEGEGKSANEIMNYIGMGRTETASVKGDVDNGNVQAGQISGMIDDIVPVQALVERLIQETKECIERLGGLFKS